MMSIALSPRWLHHMAVGLLSLLAVGCVVSNGLAWFRPEHFDGALRFTTAALFLFCLVHAYGRLGAVRALAFLVISTSLTLTLEVLGVLTGVIYGGYEYSDRLGQKLLGLVPLAVPVAWFMMIYVSDALARLLLEEGADPTGRSSWGRLCERAALTALLMAAWDLTLDPCMVANGYWTWTDGGGYFGIPWTNYLGWLLTVFAVSLLYGLCERLVPQPTPPVAQSNRLPIFAYAAVAANTVSLSMAAHQTGPAAIGLLAMAIPLLTLALRRLSPANWLTRQRPLLPATFLATCRP